MHRGEYKVPGGKLVIAEFEIQADRLVNVRITGDFFLFPEDAIAMMVDVFEGLPASTAKSEMAARIRSRLSDVVEMLGFGPDDVAEAVHRGLP